MGSVKPVLRALLVWLGILLLAVANGLLRESLLAPLFGRPLALTLSGLLLATMIFLVAFLSLPWLGMRGAGRLWLLGLGWLTLTLLFEFSFGWAQGKSWSVMLEAYRFEDGNIWPVVLIVTALSPPVAARLRARM